MRLVMFAMLVVCGFLLISAEPRSQLRRRRQLNILDTITDEQMEDTEINPWVPCVTLSADGETLLKRDFCRLECVASWSYAPQRMQCEKLDPGPLIARSFSVGGAAFRELSENSFSKVSPPSAPHASCHAVLQDAPPSLPWQVNSGEAAPDDPDVG